MPRGVSSGGDADELTQQTAAVLAVAGMALVAMPAQPDALEDAVAAYKSGDYATALKLLRPLVESGEEHAQQNLGYLYEKGYGVPQDYAEAQIIEAERMARDWKPKPGTFD